MLVHDPPADDVLLEDALATSRVHDSVPGASGIDHEDWSLPAHRQAVDPCGADGAGRHPPASLQFAQARAEDRPDLVALQAPAAAGTAAEEEVPSIGFETEGQGSLSGLHPRSVLCLQNLDQPWGRIG